MLTAEINSILFRSYLPLTAAILFREFSALIYTPMKCTNEIIAILSGLEKSYQHIKIRGKEFKKYR